MSDLKKMRLSKGITQKEAASRIGISLRSYISYENDEKKADSPKYRFILSEIAKACNKIFPEYDVEYCYLFGSYAKNRATESSDVDLLIYSHTSGIRYYELVERMRESLHKKIDLLDYKQLLNNATLLNEVLKEGIRIYG